MIDLILGTIFTAQVLGSREYQIQPLDPRIVIREEKQEVEKTKSLEGKLTLNLSGPLIDFGVIKPTSPVLRENTLTVSSSGSLGYSLVAFEDHPLRQSFPPRLGEAGSEASPLRPSTGSGQDIPDSTCDNGTCRENLASEWTNPLAYGFGLSITPAADGNKYFQFANEEASETKQSILSGLPRSREEIKITYKVNVSKTQTNGVYANKITYILVSNF